VCKSSSVISTSLFINCICRTWLMASWSHQLCTLLVCALLISQNIIPHHSTDAVPPVLVGWHICSTTILGVEIPFSLLTWSGSWHVSGVDSQIFGSTFSWPMSYSIHSCFSSKVPDARSDQIRSTDPYQIHYDKLLHSYPVHIMLNTAYFLHLVYLPFQCRDSILYRLVLANFMAHDDWASQHNITIMCRAIPHIMCSFPAITCQTQDTFPHLRNAFPCSRLEHILAHLCILVHLRISSRTFIHLHVSSCTFMSYCAYSHFITHLHVLSWFSAHHRRSIHPLSSQFLGASHSIYYYIWLCLASYNYYFIMDCYFTSLTYLEHSWFTSEPWEGAYVRLRVAMSVFTT